MNDKSHSKYFISEVVAQSNVLEGVKDANSDGLYNVRFGDLECQIQIAVTKYRDWETERSGFDGNLYGKYYIEIQIKDSGYRMFFFSVDE